MPSSKRVTGNFNFWTGASENWSYFDGASNANVIVRRGNKDTVFQSANLVVYGNIVGLGGSIYANISGNIVLGNGINYGIVYKDPDGNASVSNEFTIDEANNAVAMTGNITVSGAGKGNVIANNISSNRVTATFATITSANIGTANIATNGNITAGNIRAVSYLNLAGGNVLYGNSNVASYLPTYNANALFSNITVSRDAVILGNLRVEGNTTYINVSDLVIEDKNIIVAANANATMADLNGAGLQIGNRTVGGNITFFYDSTSNVMTLSYGANIANVLNVAGNITSTNNIIATSNVFANYILGNITQATGYYVYSNANVEAYLPTYTGNLSSGNIIVSGNLETANANISGLGIFSSVNNLRIPGGNVGQAMISNGAGGVSFQDIAIIPGNSPGSFQYNANGSALYGLDDFTYVTVSNVPRVQLTNLNFTIDKANSNANVQLKVIGNLAVDESPFDANTGYILIGGIDRLAPQDLSGNIYDGQFVIVNGSTLNYASAITGITSGNVNQIVIGGNSGQSSISIANSGVTAGTYGNANALSITVGQDGRVTSVSNVALGDTGVTAGTYGSATAVGQITIARDGRITSASSTTISLSLGISNSGTTSTLAVPSQTLTVQGTTNRVTSSLSGQTYTLSAPQDLHTSALFQVSSLGVGTAPSGSDGEIVATGNIIAYFSDDRLKTRLGNIENALDKIDQLTTFYFEPNDIAVNTYGYTRHRDLGVSAQEVANVVPEIIADAPIGDGYLTVKYERFAPLIIAAIKELRQEIKEIKRKI